MLLKQPAALSKKHTKPDSSEICTAILYLSLIASSLALPFLHFQKFLGINSFLKSTHFTYQLFSPEKISNPLKTYKEEKSSNTIAFPCFSCTLTSFDIHLKEHFQTPNCSPSCDKHQHRGQELAILHNTLLIVKNILMDSTEGDGSFSTAKCTGSHMSFVINSNKVYVRVLPERSAALPSLTNVTTI